MKGIDTCRRIPDAQKLKDNGLAFACRYLVPPETFDKAVIAEEAAGLLGAGLGLLLCWETSASRARDGAAAGARDGERARKCAEALGVPESTAIYFAVDYVPPQHDYDAIEYYLRSAGVACRPYGCGIYGPYAVVEEMVRRIPTLYVWQCVGGSGGKISSAADVYQYEWQHGDEAEALAEILGYSVDLNTCEDLQKAGMWLPETKKPWYASTMAWCEKRGLIRDGRPHDPVTRAELSMVLWRLCEGPEDIFDEDQNRPSGLLSDE